MNKYLPGLLVVLIAGLLVAQRTPPEDVDLGPERRIMSAEEAMTEIFGKNLSTRNDTLRITAGESDSLMNILNRPIRDSVLVVRHLYREKIHLGYAVVTNEYGKYRPITMMIGVTPEFKVKGVRILVYRENRGGEVKRKRFLYQYRGKSLDDPIRINRDIINISGATISVRGVNAGVRKILTILQRFYREPS